MATENYKPTIMMDNNGDKISPITSGDTVFLANQTSISNINNWQTISGTTIISDTITKNTPLNFILSNTYPTNTHYGVSVPENVTTATTLAPVIMRFYRPGYVLGSLSVGTTLTIYPVILTIGSRAILMHPGDTCVVIFNGVSNTPPEIHYNCQGITIGVYNHDPSTPTQLTIHNLQHYRNVYIKGTNSNNTTSYYCNMTRSGDLSSDFSIVTDSEGFSTNAFSTIGSSLTINLNALTNELSRSTIYIPRFS